MKDKHETYLGDGLYVSFDGWQLILRAPRAGGDHIVALEPQVYGALIDYVKRLKAGEYRKPKEDGDDETW